MIKRQGNVMGMVDFKVKYINPIIQGKNLSQVNEVLENIWMFMISKKVLDD